MEAVISYTLRVAAFVALAAAGLASPGPLWFDAPARQYTEAMPIGNGRLGAMVYGGTNAERLVLNESGMWSGSVQEADRPGAAAALPEIRRLLLAGDNVAAEKLVDAHFTCAGAGTGRGRGEHLPYGSYQLLGELALDFGSAPASHYWRELDLATAEARVEYDSLGTHFVRETIASAPDECLVERIAANRPGQVNFVLRLSRPETGRVEAVGHELRLTGALDNGKGGRGVEFAARARIQLQGGTLVASGGALRVQGADAAWIILTAATDLTRRGSRRGSAEAQAGADLAAAVAQSFGALRERQEADYRRYFDRVKLRLGADRRHADALARLPIPRRLIAYQQSGDDPALSALYFDFGRYLLISSSRPGGLPANLQGLWAAGVATPWNGDWHLNVNLQMNYWPAEVCNLSELTEPLFQLIAGLQQPGAHTAQVYYDAPGWVTHVVTNPWGFTSPGEAASWGATSTCGAWLCQHLWDHYRFKGDRAFLAWAYPIMRGAAEFYLQTLITDPRTGWLVTAPSNSPENSFRLPDGQVAHICLGATADQQIVRYLFSACEQAALILDRDPALRARLAGDRARLAPTRLGPDGRVMEWQEPYAEVDPHHRHSAHLWGLYPGDEISPAATPALAAGARRSLEVRGDEGTGWGLAFKALLWARLGDGDHAWTLLKRHLKPADEGPNPRQWSGGTYPDLLDAHPPFQIDGNFGGTAAIAEMLLQSGEGTVRLLPALPHAWPEGAVTGLRARGGLQADFAWSGGRVRQATLKGPPGAVVHVSYPGGATDLRLSTAGLAHLSNP